MSLLHEGATLGSYRVIEQVGMGGMATVYKAYQPSMERYVALKILPAYYAQDPKFVQRFIREARTIAKLEHKNILPVYDFGEENGVTYLAMRYLDGGTLKDVLALGRLTLSDGVEIMDQVCAALDYAHRQGVIHRDVKPANIMIDGEGSAYLTDFGIAKVLESTSSLTETGAPIGTPAYMAPEQSIGKQVDGRSDIYALGVILYEITVGRPPYQADTPMAIALAHIHEPLPLPRSVDPSIPDPIQNVILKTLAKKPDDRYQTAGEMARALKSALAEAGVRAGETTLRSLATMAQNQIASQTIKVPPGTFGQGPTAPHVAPPPVPSRRRLSPLALGGLAAGVVILIVLIAGGAVLLSGSGRSPASPVTSEAVTPTTETTQAAPTDPALYDDFNNYQYDGRINPGLWSLDSNRQGCGFSQRNGVLAIDFKTADVFSFCYLNIGRPGSVRGSNLGAVESRIRLLSGHNGGFANSRMFNITYFDGDNHWLTDCRLITTPSGALAEFWVGRMTDGIEKVVFSQTFTIEEDQWYTLRMTVEPDTMAAQCLLDGALLGAYTPDDGAELRDRQFVRVFSGDGEKGVSATFEIDYVRVELAGG